MRRPTDRCAKRSLIPSIMLLTVCAFTTTHDVVAAALVPAAPLAENIPPWQNGYCFFLEVLRNA